MIVQNLVRIKLYFVVDASVMIRKYGNTRACKVWKHLKPSPKERKSESNNPKAYSEHRQTFKMERFAKMVSGFSGFKWLMAGAVVKWYYYCKMSFSKTWTQVLRKVKSCSRRVGDSRWGGSLAMVLAGNKAERLSTKKGIQFIAKRSILDIWQGSEYTSAIRQAYKARAANKTRKHEGTVLNKLFLWIIWFPSFTPFQASVSFFKPWKPLFFNVFRGHKKATLTWNDLMHYKFV